MSGGDEGYNAPPSWDSWRGPILHPPGRAAKFAAAAKAQLALAWDAARAGWAAGATPASTRAAAGKGGAWAPVGVADDDEDSDDVPGGSNGAPRTPEHHGIEMSTAPPSSGGGLWRTNERVVDDWL